MMSWQKIPKLIRFLFVVFWVNVFLFTLWRVAFWLYFSEPGNPMPGGELAQAFFIGFKYDVRLSLLIVVPVYLLAWFKPINLFAATYSRRIWLSYFSVTSVLAVLFYVINFGHYAYLHVPLNATALRFLDNFDTSMLMVWQSYHVVWILLGLLLLTSVYNWFIHRLMVYFAGLPSVELVRRQRISIVTLTTVIILFGIYGKFSWYPLRWSDAFASTHPLAPSVTINPVLYSLNTLKNRQIDYDIDTTKAFYDDIAAFLQVDNPNKEQLNYQRIGYANSLKTSRPNIVMVFLESFAAYKSGLGGNPLNPTPNVDAIAKEGIYFNNFFTPHTGTARSVFAAMTGMPDIELVKTSTRNPLAVNQHIIIDELSDYKKYYFIGGSASWGNIRGLLQHNIPDLHLYEEGSYTSPSIDVWGISDIDLFKEANLELQKQTKPFFAVIQTSGNHRPYTIPEDNHGFELDNRAEKEIKQYGFQSSEEFNSFRFMDHCVGYFMQIARQQPYFDNTIFVFFGDHGIFAEPGKHTPKSESLFGLQSYRVPLLIYAPKLLPKGQRIEKVASEVDLLPTLAGLSTDKYINTTIGRDLFDTRFDNDRYAFIAAHDYNTVKLGLVSDSYYLTMEKDGSKTRLHALHGDNPKENIAELHPQITDKMARLTRAIFESTRYMRYHNETQ